MSRETITAESLQNGEQIIQQLDEWLKKPKREDSIELPRSAVENIVDLATFLLQHVQFENEKRLTPADVIRATQGANIPTCGTCFWFTGDETDIEPQFCDELGVLVRPHDICNRHTNRNK
jgi:hypothetical protein